MWMNDYEYEFTKDSMEKKNVARSAGKARTHCGKRGAVRLPSDNLTKKEIKAMSGECISYASLKNPMSFKEFKQLPVDLRKVYLEYIDDQFERPPYTEIAKMLGVAGNTLSMYAAECGIVRGKGNVNNKWKKNAFYAWVSGADMEASIAPVEDEPVDILSEDNNEVASEDSENTSDSNFVSDGGKASEAVVPTTGNLTFTANADQALDTVRLLLGNKKVKITVYWDVVND